MIFSLFLMLIQSPDCSLKATKDSDSIFELHYQDAKAKVEALGPDAKIKSCKLWPNHSDLIVLEINLGTTGTESSGTTTDLMIFKRGGKKKELEQIYDREISEENTSVSPDGKGQKIGVAATYKLVDLKGKPTVEWALPSDTKQKVDQIENFDSQKKN